MPTKPMVIQNAVREKLSSTTKPASADNAEVVVGRGAGQGEGIAAGSLEGLGDGGPGRAPFVRPGDLDVGAQGRAVRQG